MKTRLTIASALLGAATALLTASQAQVVSGADDDGIAPLSIQAKRAFLESHPGTALSVSDGRISRVHGNAFSHGASELDSAGSFVQQHSGLFGVPVSDLVPVGPWGGGDHVLPLIWDAERHDWKFFVVGYKQEVAGIPVFRSDLRVLTRNEPGSPAVLASSSLRDLGSFRDAVVASSPTLSSFSKGKYAAQALRLHGRDSRIDSERLVVWAGYDELNPVPRLAVELVIVDGDPSLGAENYHKVLYVVDAQSGAFLYEENLICNFDITGAVRGNATQGWGADECGAEISTALPHSKITLNGTTYYCNAAGNFVIPGLTSGTVSSTIGGKYFTVNDNGGSLSTVTGQALGLPVNLLHNPANTSEYVRAQVNAYLHANMVRDFTLSVAPSYPVIADQQNWPINVQVSGSCNAFYNGSSINFYAAGGGCNNTSFSVVVHHEYGHHLVACAGSGQGAYGEGMSDVMSVLISQTPMLAVGFYQGNCTSGIRNADNACQYSASSCSSCGSAIHACGQLISGCVYDLCTHPTGGYAVAAPLAINSMPLHSGTTINSDITIDFLTLDDNDSNINNGTPNFSAIEQSFALHGLSSGISLPEVAISVVSAPTMVHPLTGATVSCTISGGTGTPNYSTLRLNHRVGTSGSYTASTMTNSGGTYSANLPGAACFATIQYYISIQTTSGNTISSPVTSATVATGNVIAIDDTMETNMGWTVGASGDSATTGIWERAVPQSTAAQPGADHTPTGTMCFITGPLAGSSLGTHDIDGGITTLTSPAFDATSGGTLSFWLWYSNDQGSTPETDTFPIEISNNNGASYLPLETLPTTGSTNAWVLKEYNISSVITPSAQMRVRFRAADLDSGSIVEAAVDDFSFGGLECDDTPSTPGDLNGDGIVNGVDLSAMLAGWGTAGGDANGDGTTDGVDLGVLLANWGG
ncbi:MAG: hypothetical protein O2855_06075 [Planctomycetota bacterium]|nr:hypothetical protein [Planctomycetota bacterium]